MNDLKAIIFDLDGTLLDTLDDLTAAVNHALTTFNLGTLDRSRIRRYVGNGVPKLIERVLYYVTTGDEPDLDNGTFDDRSTFNAVLAVFTQYYDKHNSDLTRPYDGIPEMLEKVKAAGYKSAIVTNKYDGAAQALKAKFFGTVDLVVGEQSGIRPKPAPDGVLRALEVLGVDKSQAIYVGDGETDMKTAENCGMPVVAVTWGFRDRGVLSAFSPDHIIDQPSELITKVLDING
ncbi:MAG: HAD-IA family hydrolase [Clostridiales bacterium]|nr:HAD-IA family hydrolase [Clostridiales bacterium]